MLFNIWQNFNQELASIQLIILILNALLHLLFAGAVAKDAGQITKQYGKTQLVSAVTWAFAVLIGGILVAIGYWFIHHHRSR